MLTDKPQMFAVAHIPCSRMIIQYRKSSKVICCRIPLQLMMSKQGKTWTVEVKMMDDGFLSRQQIFAFPIRLV